MERQRLSKFYIKLNLANKRAAKDDGDGLNKGNAKRANRLPSIPDLTNAPPVDRAVTPEPDDLEDVTDDRSTDFGNLQGNSDDEMESATESSDSSCGALSMNHSCSPDPSVIKDAEWTILDVCAMMLYTAKSNGVTNATLDNFLKVVALVINGKRNVEDDRARSKFPASVRSVKTALKISHEEQQKVIHICPTKRLIRKKGEDIPTTEICGYTLHPHYNPARKTSATSATAECIDHVMCYRYKKDPILKSHEKIAALSERWHTLTPAEQKKIHEDRTVGGFKRPSLVRHWEKFDVVEGFAQDVMHQMDEGLSKGFLKAVVEGSSVMKLSKNQVNEIDRRWLSITVPGHDNRKLRSIRTYKQWKAHELRFFLQHGGPFVTNGLVPDAFYKILCLASSIAWTCTRDSVTVHDVKTVEKACTTFLKNFQNFFGVRAMKYSVHLVQHIPMALRLFGPLHLVSCYRPENEIGKISRRICGTNNTTKQIMNSFLTLTECSNYLSDVISLDSKKNSLVMKTVLQVMDLPMPVFSATASEGRCRLLGKPELLMNKDELSLLGRHPEIQRARLEVGIFPRTSAHNEKSLRNESIIMDKDQKAWKVFDIIAVMGTEASQVGRTFVYGEKMEKVDANRVGVDHVYAVQASGTKQVFPTAFVGHEGQKGLDTRILYHVKWYGYPKSKNTWEPEESLLQSGDAIAEYWRMVNCLKEYDSRPKRGETYKSKKEASKEFQRLINELSSILKEDPCV
ncbi:hypothetical protein RvY_00158 [Ramazzottius varieornatus]|uniref:Chromo domain-containing protein n=1 Tax=Ramazzottius varieornatus TaxID=947166 RepID=A0A1D1UBQ3_RAMVA|nr:hypothetical protein RvY_00158 [Ramazzottius varieornatus]